MSRFIILNLREHTYFFNQGEHSEWPYTLFNGLAFHNYWSNQLEKILSYSLRGYLRGYFFKGLFFEIFLSEKHFFKWNLTKGFIVNILVYKKNVWYFFFQMVAMSCFSQNRVFQIGWQHELLDYLVKYLRVFWYRKIVQLMASFRLFFCKQYERRLSIFTD